MTERSEDTSAAFADGGAGASPHGEHGMLDVVVVGAGPAGLAAAHALAEAGRTVRVLEAAATVGGRMRTAREHGCLIDTGAEMFPGRPAYPATWRLISALGLDTDPAAVPRVPDALAVWRGGRTRPHVGRPLGLLTGAGLPLRARLDVVRLQARLARLADLDPQRPEHTALGESTIADLVRPYHPDLCDYLVHPLVGGFFGWDPEHSAAAPFAAHLTSSGASHTWHTYRDGMDTLARALAARLDVETGHPITRVTAVPCPDAPHECRPHPDPGARADVGPGECAGAGVRVESRRGAVMARAVVLAVPAPVAVRLHDDAAPAVREFLKAGAFAPMLRVSLVLDRPMAPRGRRPRFATLVPDTVDPLLGVITTDHHKHPGRVPNGRGLLSLIASPRGTAELMGVPDDGAANRLIARAERFVPGLSRHIAHVRVHRFRYGLPEATPRALRLRAAFERRPAGPVEYAGDWTALRPCSEGAVASGGLAAARVLAHLSDTPSRRPEVIR